MISIAQSSQPVYCSPIRIWKGLESLIYIILNVYKESNHIIKINIKLTNLVLVEYSNIIQVLVKSCSYSLLVHTIKNHVALERSHSRVFQTITLPLFRAF